MDNQRVLQKEAETTDSSILITGGHGLLGTHLSKILPDAHRPTRSEMDIREDLFTSKYFSEVHPSQIRTVIHCAALKNEASASNHFEAMRTNILGTVNVVLFCEKIKAKIVYISTDYVFKGDRGDYEVGDEVGPTNPYAETKLAGEYVSKCVDHLVIRLSFFPDIFPYEKAFADQLTTRVTATEAAQRIVELIRANASGVRHIAGPKRSGYEFAVATSNGKEIQPMYLRDTLLIRPKDTSLKE